MTRLRLSDHFVIEEFDCHDGSRVPLEAVPSLKQWCLVWGEPLRRKFGPVSVTSGFRPDAYNRRVGGAPSSFHRYELRRPRPGSPSGVIGLAADVVARSGDPQEWAEWAHRRRVRDATWLRMTGSGGVGRYSGLGFVHLDTGPRRQWAG